LAPFFNGELFVFPKNATNNTTLSHPPLEWLFCVFKIIYGEVIIYTVSVQKIKGNIIEDGTITLGKLDATVQDSIGSGGGGSSYMLKSVYDTNNNGVVDQAAKLQTARTITLTGGVTGSASFDGSSNITISTSGGSSGSPTTRLSVKDFGAKGDGVTDDSAAFKATWDFIYANIETMPSVAGGGDGDRRPNYVFYIPAGEYIITQPESMMKSTSTTKTLGLRFEGDGKFTTFIYFQPSVAESYLLINNNAWMHLQFEGIAFVANNKTNACWMKSTSTGGAQNFSFSNCVWGGSWMYGLQLLGTNVNSEMSWHHCNVNGDWNKFLYVPQSVGTVGDQFVNYNFYACNMEVAGGSFIDMAYGGSIGIFGGSYMYYNGTSIGGTMFVFRNQGHNNGASRFGMYSTRVEVPTAECKLFHCEWGFGAVGFYNVDTSTQQFLNDARVRGVNVEFEFGNEPGPVITWSNCTLQGKHSYTHGSEGYSQSPRILYDNCEIWHWDDPSDFIVTTGTNSGGHALCRFTMCRGKGMSYADHSKYIWETTYNWHLNGHATADRKIVHLGNAANGGLPVANNSWDVFLPMNVVVVAARIYLAPGVTSSTATGWSITLRSSGGSPTTLLTATPTSDNPSLGINAQTASTLWHRCSSDDLRHLVLTSNSAVNHADVAGLCIIEYIG
jgi:hypothetical protein